MNRRRPRLNAVKNATGAVYGLLFIFWIGLVGGYDGQLISFAQFLGSTVLIVLIGYCVYQLCWKIVR